MRTYSNPIATAEVLTGGFADPFVMRFNGTYYLYCTAPEVPCWTSTDLVCWKPERATMDASEFPGLVPFAPEVFYADGDFFMVTSPHGRGHYVLRSESPLGPFRRLTPNLGRAIDGHVLIDDDGRWYFYWAGWEGIWASEMLSPTELGEPVLTGAHMNGWTEGPSVTKRDGRYYMTLTGNHYLSPGYRVNGAVSDNPLTGFVDDPMNPLLLSAYGPTIGLGHPSTITGPDLVSSYLVYHSLRADRLRDLNIDRLIYSQGSQQVLGPSELAPAPSPADIESRWPDDREAWTVRAELATDGSGWATMGPGDATWVPVLTAPFTLEASLIPAPRTVASVTLARDNAHPELSIRFDPALPGVVVDGSLVGVGRRYRHDSAHTIRVVHDGGRIRVLLDGREVLDRRQPPAPLKLAVQAEEGDLKLGYVGATRATPAIADQLADKPVPGRFWGAPPSGAGNDAPNKPAGLLLPEGERAGYRLIAARPGRYRVLLAGEGMDTGTATVSTNRETVPMKAVSHTVGWAVVDLRQGEQELWLASTAGDRSVSLVEVRPEVSTSGLRVTRRTVEANCKQLILEHAPLDFILSAEVEVDRAAASGHADLLLRASQLALGFEGQDERLGVNFLLGYSVQIHADRVALERHDYDATLLGEWHGQLLPSLPQRIDIHARGGAFDIALNGVRIISACDRRPHLVGGFGVRTVDAKLHIPDLSIVPWEPDADSTGSIA